MPLTYNLLLSQPVQISPVYSSEFNAKFRCLTQMMTQLIGYGIGLWRIARPLQLLAFVVLYVTGVLVALGDDYLVSIRQFAWGLILLLVAGASIHYSNEHADFESDKLTTRTPFSGGSGVLSEGFLSRRIALVGMWILLVCTLLVAGFAVITTNLTITAFIVLLVGIVGGWMYSLPPLRLAWRGMGEIDNAILGGTLLAVYGFTVVTGFIAFDIIPMFLPFTGIVFVNLLATTWTDRIADSAVGKYTLATRLSKHTLRRIYALVAVGSYGLLLVFTGWIIPLEIVIGNILISPLVVWGYRRYTIIESPHPTVLAMIAMMMIYLAGSILQL